MRPRLRGLFGFVVIGLGAWALWPPSGTDSGSSNAKERNDRKYILRVAPNLYLPGRRLNPGDPPLKGMRDVADAFEKLVPDTRIELVEAPLGQREWLVTQLSAATAPDIVDVNVEDVWQDVQKGWYVPLDKWLDAPNPFVPKGQPGSRQWWDIFKYQAITRGKAAPDGLSYCMTLDMIETGIFYNKTLFRKLGVRVPKDWADFERIQTIIQKAGYTPTVANIGALADWGVDLTFDQLYRSIRPTLDLRTDPKRAGYLKAYLDWDELCFLHQKGFFTKHDPRWRELFRILKAWRRFMPKDLGGTDEAREFVQGRAAMYWMHSQFVQRMVRDPDVNFDWGIFYLPPITTATSRFGIGVPQCVIGGAASQLEVTNSAFADTGDPATSERTKRCVQFLQFLTLPKNCDHVVNEIMAQLPNVVGVAPHKELEPFDEFLHRDYTTTKWEFTFDLRFTEILNRMLLLYLVDGATEDEFMDWMEKSVDLATDTVMRRKKLDLAPLQKRWDELVPLRRTMKELPAEATR